MITILSPAKALNFNEQHITRKYTLPESLNKSETLIKKLRKLSKKQIADLMNLSDKLAALNVDRYLAWTPDFSQENAKQAILTFNGDVYSGLDASTLTEEDLIFAQNHVRILSGLHGILKPLDLIKPYRLEMGTKLSGKGFKNITEFWSEEITSTITKLLEDNRTLVNLASNEYFKTINKKKITNRIITPVFKDYKNGTYKSLFLFVKQARGMMTRFIIKNRIDDPEQLKNFEEKGYFYNDAMSGADEFVFTRG